MIEVIIMQNIRPVSDLRNNWNEVDAVLAETQEPIIFTKNGYGKYVLFDTETYRQHQINTEIYYNLKLAEQEEILTSERYDGVELMSELIAELENR